MQSPGRTRRGVGRIGLEPGRIFPVLAGLFLAAMAGGPASAQIAPGGALPDLVTPPTGDASTRALPVRHILIRGNSRAESTFVAEASGLELGHPTGRQALQSAVRSLYGLGLFSNVRVFDETPPDAEARTLVIDVDENPRVREITWVGNDEIGAEDLKAEIDLRAGDILGPGKLFQAKRALEAAYADEGYASAAIRTDVVHEDDGRAVALTFDVEEGERVKITDVVFEGAAAFEPGKLRGEIELKPNNLFRRKRYTAERLREDVQRIEEFYHNHGYMEAQVTDAAADFSEDRGEVVLRFDVDEGPFYQFGEVGWEGNTQVETDRLRATTPIRGGEPFSQEKIDAGTAEAYSHYTEKGYLLGVQVTPETNVDEGVVDVTYHVREGVPSNVNEIKIVGNTRTREYVIRRELTLVPGDRLRRSRLMRSQRDVFALGFFEDVAVEYRPAGRDNDIDVIFRVKEKSSGTATAGAGYSSDTGLTGFLEFGHNNIFGRGQAVNLHLERGSQRETYDISFTDPWAFGTPTSLGFQVFSTQRDIDIYEERRRGFALNVGRRWFFPTPDFTRVFASYSLEDLDFSDFQNLDPTSEQFLRESAGTVSRISLALSRNSTNSPFYPTAGSRTTLRSEFAGGYLGGEIHYYKPVLDHRNYFVPFWTPAVMLRHRLSYVGSFSGHRVPGSETFRLGGTRSEYLRGYDDWYVVPEDNITHTASGREVRFPGGKVAYTFTAEYQFPIVSSVHGAIFYDAGNTWNSIRDFSLSGLKKGVGAGLRVEIPLLGNVGFDYAYGIDRGKWEPHLIIGPAF